MIEDQQKQCPYCKNIIKTSSCQECADVIYDICATTLRKKTNQQSIFEQVDNLVFQGGGVKGVAYLGVLEELHQQNENLLTNVKRIAGTSAGSIVALYLGLNKDINDIAALLQDSDYSKLLDDGPTYSVNVNSFWFDSKFKAKDIVLKTLDYLTSLKKWISETTDQKKKDKRVKKILEAIISYIGAKFGWTDRAIIKAISWWVIPYAVAWFAEAFLTEPRDPKGDAEKARVEDSEFQKKIKELSEQIIDEIDQLKKQIEEKYPPQKPDAPQKKSDLDDEDTLLYAITEMVWSGIEGDPSADPQKKASGIFVADKIKEKMIEKPIYDSLKMIGKENQYKAGEVTFAELASLTRPDGKPAFKPFYMCVFNTATFRIDIFSAEHTPNALVADAVRASMSIPLFFRSVNIREKRGGVISPIRTFSPFGTFPTIYMDGGILSNYPIWLFDDLRYCMDEKIRNWPANQKVNIQNPNTLGFRLLDLERIDIYRRPYYDDQGKKLKLVQEAVNIGDYFAVAKFLTTVNIDEHEENAGVQRGDYYRTAYLYNCNISAVNFKLDPEQQHLLIAAGHQAVRSLKERAENSFNGELGSYFPPATTKGKEDNGKQPEQQNP